MSSLISWLRQGSTGAGIVAALATLSANVFHVAPVTGHPGVTIIGGLAAAALMAFPEAKLTIGDLQVLLTEALPLGEDLLPAVEKLADDIKTSNAASATVTKVVVDSPAPAVEAPSTATTTTVTATTTAA